MFLCQEYMIHTLLMWLIELRLEEKLANIESENKVLRQQAVSIAPNKFLSGRSRSILQVF